MQWLELSIKVPWELVEPISYLFNRHGSGLSIESLEDDRVLLRTYLPSTAKKRMARIDIGARLVAHLAPSASLDVTELKQEDWESAWKAHYSLLKIGHRLIIRPPWIEHRPADGEVIITLDPGMAFGTGYHPTTRLCLCALERLVKPGMAVLDLGTGSGILAISAALLGAGSVLGIDTDPIAVKVARGNCKANGLGRRVRLARGSLPHPLASPQAYDLVVANISSKTIQEKASPIRQALRPGGILIASGLFRQQDEEVGGVLSRAGFGNISSQHLEDWASITAR